MSVVAGLRVRVTAVIASTFALSCSQTTFLVPRPMPADLAARINDERTGPVTVFRVGPDGRSAMYPQARIVASGPAGLQIESPTGSGLIPDGQVQKIIVLTTGRSEAINTTIMLGVMGVAAGVFVGNYLDDLNRCSSSFFSCEGPKPTSGRTAGALIGGSLGALLGAVVSASSVVYRF